MARVGLVTALLPPAIGGTQVLVWRLFQSDPQLAVVSGVEQSPPSDEGYSPLAAPTLWLPYPRLRGYRYGLAPVLGAYSAAWLATAVVRAARFFKSQGVDHVISIPHGGPFALVGLLAARRLGIAHTLYILDAWEEGSAGPVEHALIRWGLRLAARMPRSRVAVVSPALGDYYRRTYGFRDVTWIPNPAPLPEEHFPTSLTAEPIVVFTGGIKPFNLETIQRVMRSVRRCKVVKRLVSHRGRGTSCRETGRARPRRIPRLLARRARRAAGTGGGAAGRDQRGRRVPHIAGIPAGAPARIRLARRPILLIGPQRSEAARAVRHWSLGPTTTSQDEGELAGAARCARDAGDGRHPDAASKTSHDLFLELFSRREARRRLLGETRPPLSARGRRAGCGVRGLPRG